jgi:hypothetical protein
MKSKGTSPFSGNPSILRRRGTVPGHHAPRSVIHTICFAFLLAVLMMNTMTLGSMYYGFASTSPEGTRMNQPRGHELPPVVVKRRNHRPPSNGLQILSQLRQEFDTRYGSFGPTLLQKGLDAFGSIDTTAARMVDASVMGRPFVMAFSGYSVTVGRGNFFNESFPFVVQRILAQPLQDLLGIPLVVRNAAIGGIPSFPYSFCLEHFVGDDPDVLSWDYSMNEGKSASALEAFVRQSLQRLSKRPMIIMLDKDERRSHLLKQYTDMGILGDAITVGRKEDVFEGGTTSTLPNLQPLPPGFQEWDEFGAPARCPGRGNWHPKRQEHSMIGWIIAMHFVKVLERAYEMLLQNPEPPPLRAKTSRIIFPKPVSPMPDNDPEVNEILFGHRQEGAEDAYLMKDLSCRTSFIPTTDETKTLPSIVVSGFAEPTLDIMVDRTEQHYQKGWVLDVSTVERVTKRKVEQCGGLGYVDMKIALYGTSASGTLRLWLPFEGPSHEDHAHHSDDDDSSTDAKHWFDDLLFCEANEKRPDQACKLYEDLTIEVGGVAVTSSSIREVNGAAEYLKRKTCVNIGIPQGAKITRLGQVTTPNGTPLTQQDKAKLGNGGDDRTRGIVVDVTAKSKVTLQGGACCLSHIVWEMH